MVSPVIVFSIVSDSDIVLGRSDHLGELFLWVGGDRTIGDLAFARTNPKIESASKSKRTNAQNEIYRSDWLQGTDSTSRYWGSSSSSAGNRGLRGRRPRHGLRWIFRPQSNDRGV